MEKSNPALCPQLGAGRVFLETCNKQSDQFALDVFLVVLEEVPLVEEASVWLPVFSTEVDLALALSGFSPS